MGKVAKRSLVGKRRLAASDPGCGAEADGEPKLAVKRCLTISKLGSEEGNSDQISVNKHA